MIDVHSLTINQAHESLSKGEYTVRQLTDAYLQQIESRNAELNVYLHLYDDIDAQVQTAQDMYTAGTAGALCGIPIAIKANLQVSGQVCNAASKMLEDYRAVYDATAIAKLRAAGAVLLGSTNMDEFAMGGSTEHSAFGTTGNPVAPGRVPGGSSGGSAAAVAGGMALVALGTDTGGSIRQPAGFTNTVGFKGSYGSVSRYGAAAMGSSLDQIGPIARTVGDARTLWQCIRGSDDFDMTALCGDTWTQTENQSDVYNIAIPADALSGADPDVAEVFQSAVDALKSAGHTVSTVAIDSLRFALPAYYILMPAEVSSNTARYDGIRYGFKAPDTSDLLDEYVQTRSQGFGTEVKRRIILGTYVLSAGYGDQYYAQALALREKIKQDLDDVFAQYDVVMTPTSPTVPFAVGEKSDNPLAMCLADIYTVGANIAGIPGISVPGGLSTDQLPVGIQFLAQKTKDEMLLDMAEQFEQLIQG